MRASLTLCLLGLTLSCFGQSLFVNGSFSNIVTPGGASGGGGGGPGDGYESPYAYYKLEEASGNAVDSVSGRNFVNGGSAATLISAVIGNGYRYTDTGGQVNAQTASSSAFDLSGHDFTIRFWVRFNATDSGSFLYDDSFNWDLEQGTDGKVYFNVFDPDSINVPGRNQITSANIQDGNWHQIVVWRQVGVGIGMRADASSTTTGTESNDWSSGATRWHTSGFCSVDLDEVAIWKGYILTTTDIAFDYNSGAGQGYPLP